MSQTKSFRWLGWIVLLCLAGGVMLKPTGSPVSMISIPYGSEIAISERESNEYSPDIAYNSVHNEYLVVWENLWAGGHHDVYAQRVSSGGTILSWFAVVSSTNSAMNPTVAYDRIHDRYLVVFAYDFAGDGSDWDIYGRFIPWNGPDAGLTDFSICNWTSNQRRPTVAFGYSQQEFMVAWTNAIEGQPTYISARRIYADLSGFSGSPFLVSSGTYDRDYQDITYNLARNEYLITWDVISADGDLDIYGIRLAATGTFLTGGDPNGVGEFSIAGWPSQEERPSVAACEQTDQYLVLWQSDQSTNFADEAVYGRFLNGDAVPGNVYLVSDTTSPQEFVDVGCTTLGENYLITWQDQYVGGEFGIWARLAYPNETFSSEFEVAGPRSKADRTMPAAAGGKTSFLVAWEHDRDGGTNLDIHGRLVGYMNYMPLVNKTAP